MHHLKMNKKKGPLSIKGKIALKSGIFMSFLFFAFCKNETKHNQTLALTPTITVVEDTFVKIKTREIPIFDTIFKDMIVVKGGYAFVGSDSSGLQSENPRFWIHVQPFLMDINPVTVEQFRQFIKATGYKTEAEGFGNGGFIDETSDKAWILKEGCTWEYPEGKDYPKATDNLPVTQVSWNDAQVYAKWAGKRLPHELEYEYAARNARNDQTLYAMGNTLKTPNGKWLVNIWQGTFPFKNDLEDGYKFASPVGIFGKTPLGLTDMTGNVWQWCQNGKFNYADVLDVLKNGGKVAEIDLEKAQRGGSFLCEATWCHGYRVSGRSFTSPETALLHVGFRCIKDF
jgi:formylglycine-generating enzyme